MAVVGEPLTWMVGTEDRRVETEDANDARLESFRLREIPERFLSCCGISIRLVRRIGRGVLQHRCTKVGCAQQGMPNHKYG